MSIENVGQFIVVLRGKKVLLDSDLASLYGVTTKRFNEQVKRNLGRLPADFCFAFQIKMLRLEGRKLRP